MRKLFCESFSSKALFMYYSLSSLRLFCRHIFKSLIIENFGPSEKWILENKDKYKGETCFIFGNGPSLKDFDFKKIQKYKSFGSNGIFLTFTPSFYVSVSSEFYLNHIESIKNLSCERKFIAPCLQSSFPNLESTVLRNGSFRYGSFLGFKFPVPIRFSKHADKIVYFGGSVIFVCLQLAYTMGFQRVVLAGVDHRFGFDRSEAKYGGRRISVEGSDNIHFDPNYNPNGHSTHCDMLATERSFRLALDAFAKNKRQIFNVTPNTGLDIVPCTKLSDLI